MATLVIAKLPHMLPFYVSDTVTHSNGLFKARLPFVLGRPGLRWITWLLVSIGFFFVCWTLFVDPPFRDHPTHFSHPPHRHSPTRPPPTSPRAVRVREAFVHAYSGYKKHALPYDELLPVDGGKINK